MIPTRAALALPVAVLVLSGCGVAAAHKAHTTTVSVSLPGSADAVVSVSHLLRPLPVRPVAPTYVVATLGTGGADEWLEIMTPSGTVVARTEITPTEPWMTAVGAGGAYWTENGAEYVLSPSGAVRKLGLVPSDATGVVIAPDGSSYAYATADPLKDGSLQNRIVVAQPGAAAKVIGDRVSVPSSDTPGPWEYYLVSWTAPGIAFARVPTGGCGCGSFDMQMQSAYSAIIDPVSDGETTITADTSCPLSDLGPAMESVCFDGTSATDAIRIASAGTVTHTYTLSGKNLAGDALFSADGAELAYVTIPVAEDTCGATVTATLRILDIATGAAQSRAMGDFVPSAWSGGLIYGSVSNATDSWLVGVNPTTLAVTPLTAPSPEAGLVGIM